MSKFRPFETRWWGPFRVSVGVQNTHLGLRFKGRTIYIQHHCDGPWPPAALCIKKHHSNEPYTCVFEWGRFTWWLFDRLIRPSRPNRIDLDATYKARIKACRDYQVTRDSWLAITELMDIAIP